MYLNPNTLSNQSNYAPGLIELTPEQEQIYLQHNGFVTVAENEEEENGYTIAPDTERWEAWKAEQPDPIIQAKEVKLDELSTICNEMIYAGTDVQMSDGSTKHFTYTLADQANISEMFTAVMAGATEYPYHADGESCMMYSAADIITIYSTLSSMKTGQITYQNQLKQYVKMLDTVEDIEAVTYGQELTGEYLEAYANLIAQAQEQLQAILSKITTVLSA